jgi:hypothetical protein
MSRTIERATELVAEVLAILTAESIEGVLVTTNALAIPPALAVGAVVAIQPPKLKYVAPFPSVEATWELFVIAGPYADRLAAWATIDPIITALQLPLDIDTAEPANFQHPSMPEYPAYVLTFTELI